MPSEAETARRAGMDAENTKDVPLIRWWSTTTCEPAQKPPQEAKPFAIEPTSMSTWDAYGMEGLLMMMGIKIERSLRGRCRALLGHDRFDQLSRMKNSRRGLVGIYISVSAQSAIPKISPQDGKRK